MQQKASIKTCTVPTMSSTISSNKISATVSNMAPYAFYGASIN